MSGPGPQQHGGAEFVPCSAIGFAPIADAADLYGVVRGVDEEEPVATDPEPQLLRIALERFQVPRRQTL